MKYEDFLHAKSTEQPHTGLTDIPDLPAYLFPFQRDIVRWALRRGRAAIFAGTGLGKSLMELAWADAIHRATGKDILHLAPLAVSSQMAREADKFGLTGKHVRQQSDCISGDNITNYQKLEHFDLSRFGGVILDESSILKSFNGATRTMLIEKCKVIPFRLAATATPSPNDFMELGNHAEFLDIMSYTDMLATFFVHDGGDTSQWRLKGHAEGPFWRWMCSWAVMLQRPSDFGYQDAGYNLPPLVQNEHIVSVEYAPSTETGLLFPLEARTMSERIGARRDTVDLRVSKGADIVTKQICDKLAEWHGNQNTPSDDAQSINLTQQSASVGKGRGATQKETSNTCENITNPIKLNLSDPQSSRQRSTDADASDMPLTLHIENFANNPPVAEIQTHAETGASSQATGSAQKNTKPLSKNRADAARYAGASQNENFTLTTAIIAAGCGGFFAAHATLDLAISKMTQTGLLEPWCIWCNLNSEQDALAKYFGPFAYSVAGSMPEEQKESAILNWIDGRRPIMISKPSVLGFGMNFQHCRNTMFIGLNDSFEQVYQAIRRFWRFGQTKPVNVHFIAAETEGAVLANIRRKEADAERMGRAMVAHMASLNIEHIKGATRDRADYQPNMPVVVPSWLERENA